MMVYGYARVSSEGQSLTAQVAELKAAGCQRVFQEKISGARADRKQLARLLAELDDADTVIVTRLDRLARSTRDLLNTLQPLVQPTPPSVRCTMPGRTLPRRMGG